MNIVLYGMSYRHPNAFAALNRAAKLGKDSSSTFSLLLIWQHLCKALKRCDEGGNWEEDFKAAIHEFREIVPITAVIHEGKIGITSNKNVTKVLGLPRENVPLKEVYDTRPFGDTPLDEILKFYVV